MPTMGGAALPSGMEGVEGPAPPSSDQSEGNKGDPGSPQKRGRKEEQQLTLDMLKEVLAAERTKDRQHLADSLHEVKGDMDKIRSRMDAVEGGVTQQMHSTLAMLTKITNNYDDQAKTLSELRMGQQSMEDRIAVLEKQPMGSVPASTADTAMGDGGRKPAIIIGGWSPDQLAADTLQAARDILKQLDVPLNADSMFVPGVRRGYAILPIDHKPLESEEARRARVQAAIQRVRNANLSLGQHEQGGLRKLWIAISQSPERRRRAKLAGKVKRVILEMGGDQRAMDVEFATGTVWMGAHKISSATAEQPKDAQKAGAGWIDLKMLAKAMRKPLAEVEEAWHPRQAELQ